MNNTLIIGGGHVGLTLYADICRSRGHVGVEVAATKIPTFAGKSITMHDTVSGIDISVMTKREDFVTRNDLGALDRADVVFVTVPDIPDLRGTVLAQLFSVFANRPLTLVMIRGGQGGALWLARQLQDVRARQWNVLLVEDSLYGCRRIGDRIEFKRKENVGIAHYGPDLGSAMEAVLRALGDGQWARRFCSRTPMEILFDPLGYYIHTAVALDPGNVIRTARGEQYLHYSEGIDPTLAEQLDAMDSERVALAGAYGVRTETFPQILYRQYKHEPGEDFFHTMASTRSLYRSLSPSDLANLRNSRNLREDIPALTTMLALARAKAIEMPTTEAFASALPYLLDRIGLTDAGIDRYPSPPAELTGDDLHSLLDSRVYA